MTKERKIIVIITIISILLIAILSYFLINKNAIIEKQAEKIELQAMETNGSNSYVTTQEHLNESSQNIAKINEFKKSIANYIEEAGGVKPEYTAKTTTFGERIKGILTEVTKNATATVEDIAKGKTAYVNGELITGTLVNFNKNTTGKVYASEYTGISHNGSISVEIDEEFSVAIWDFALSQNDLNDTKQQNQNKTVFSQDMSFQSYYVNPVTRNGNVYTLNNIDSTYKYRITLF